MSAEVLNSWKEIAAYTGRGIRTIQRWEQELGFPVRRPRERSRSAVIAIKSEIDRWFQTPHKPNGNDRHQRNKERFESNAEVLQANTSQLADCFDVLRKEIDRALRIGSELQTSCSTSRTRRMDAVLSRTENRGNLDTLHRQTARATRLVAALQTTLARGEET